MLDGYWQRIAERGVDDSPYRASFAQIICVADTDAEAEQLYAEHVLYFYNRCLHIFPGFADAPGYRTIKTLQAGAVGQLHAAAQRKFSELTWKDLVDGGYVIAGSASTVCDRMKDMIRGLRVGNVFCLMHNGNQPDWKTRYSTQLFAENVMPKLQDMWPDYREDTRWWIHPLPERLDPLDTVGGQARHGAPTVIS
jgi:alkanesulfonate monooxygenase SsuD/methylene tetrahydromethanopterin reductase-like flavin-dependent oxidoreductase (luciferase family)